MYDNNIYSGEGADTNTSGAQSQQNENNSTEGYSSQSSYTGQSNYDNQANNSQSSYQGSSASQWNSSQYQPYRAEASDTNGFNNRGSEQSGKKRREKKSSGFFRKAAVSICMGLFFGLFAGVGFYGIQYATGTLVPQNQDAPVISGNVDGSTTGNVENLTAEESKSGIKLTDTTEVRVVSSDVTDVVDEVMPAMVSIINNYTETSTTFFGQTYSQERASSGSGIIVAESDTELLIVTNHHVVSEAEKLEVSFIDGTTAEAQIKGMDSDMDLAVIAISLESLTEETKSAIAIATLGDSDALKMGEPVIAIGNALGYGQSVTDGIVSALDREISTEEGSANTFIQTNAAINPGNSGGALLNVYGEVIGINSNKIGATAVEGMCYAIPISAAKPIIADLMLKETRVKVEDGKVGYMGISMQTITSEFSQMYNIPAGVYVIEVESGSPADKAGLLSGDIIVKFEGEKISTHQDLQSIMQYYGAGTEVSVTVRRPVNGKYETVDMKITLGERPATQQ